MWQRWRRHAGHDVAMHPHRVTHLVIDRAPDWLLQFRKKAAGDNVPTADTNSRPGREMMSQPTPVNRRSVLTMLGGSVAAPMLASRTAFAQEAWPTRQVRYVNGFPAGGATDTLSRIICQKMSELSGQSFVVENRGGAGGVLGADAIAKSAPDGYTVGLGGIASNVLAMGSYAKLPYDPVGDFTFIGGMWQLPNILCGEEGSPVLDHPGGDCRLQERSPQIHLRVGRLRHDPASLGRDDEQHGRRGGRPHSLQGRRSGVDRPARGPGRSPVRQSAGFAAERTRRADQAARRHRDEAHSRAAGCAGHGRGAAGICHDVVDGAGRDPRTSRPMWWRR